MTSPNPPLKPSNVPVSDWLRGAFLLVAFTALGWLLLTRYSGSSRFEPQRRVIREFVRAAVARDSTRLKTLVAADQPLRWALRVATETPWLLPPPDSALALQGPSRAGDAETFVVWTAGPCTRQPYFVTLVGEGHNRRIEAVRTDCTKATDHDER